jgi:two-component system, NarL family, sensor histidine kinase DevS
LFDHAGCTTITLRARAETLRRENLGGGFAATLIGQARQAQQHATACGSPLGPRNVNDFGGATSGEHLDEVRLRRLLDVGRSLVSELDVESVLQTVLEAARDLTGARYAALGVLNDGGDGLERFLTLGIDGATRARIGDLPQGHGVLGVLIKDPKPLRLADVGTHPHSYGFPAGHPPMTTFLGVPVRIREAVFGNLYLTDKPEAAEFDEADEAAVVVLAEWAGHAIANARLYRSTLERRDDLQRAVAGFEAALAVARAVGGETDLDRILELIVKRGRALVDARSMFVALESDGRLTLDAVAGELARSLEHRPVEIGHTPAADVLAFHHPVHLAAEGDATVTVFEGLEARAALLVPLVFRGVAVGLLGALDPASGADHFTSEDARILESFASSGATAVATGRNVAEERARRVIEASEAERRRWARELHDETLQDLASLKMILSAARRSDDPANVQRILDQAIEQLTHGIASLRQLITDLRPPILDEAGVQPALEHLVERLGLITDLDVRMNVDLAYESGRRSYRLSPALEDALFRVVQEALHNVVKHAHAKTVDVSIVEADNRVDIRISDDGVGLDEDHKGGGFGLVGMRERIELAGGSLEIASPAGSGTEIRASVPVSPAPAGTRAETSRG